MTFLLKDLWIIHFSAFLLQKNPFNTHKNEVRLCGFKTNIWPRNMFSVWYNQGKLYLTGVCPFESLANVLFSHLCCVSPKTPNHHECCQLFSEMTFNNLHLEVNNYCCIWPHWAGQCFSCWYFFGKSAFLQVVICSKCHT